MLQGREGGQSSKQPPRTKYFQGLDTRGTALEWFCWKGPGDDERTGSRFGASCRGCIQIRLRFREGRAAVVDCPQRQQMTDYQ